MCPFCVASAALMAGSLMSTVGLTALTVKLRAEAVAKKFISEPKPKEDGSWPLAETAENAEQERKMKSKLDLDKSKNGRKKGDKDHGNKAYVRTSATPPADL